MGAHSKWPEESSTTSEKTVMEFHRLFAIHGLHEQIVTESSVHIILKNFKGEMELNTYV